MAYKTPLQNSQSLSAVKKALSFFIIALLVIYPLLISLESLGLHVGLFDGSIPLVRGMLIKNGLIPHKDFFFTYTPLNFYLTSLIFSVLGKSVLYVRIVKSFFYILTIFAFLYYFKSLRIRHSMHYLFLLLLLLAIGKTPTYTYWNAHAFGLISLVLYLVTLQKKDKKYHFFILTISGIFSGLSCLTKLNFGLFITFSVILDSGLALVFALITQKEKKYLTSNPKKILSDITIFLLPVLLCFIFYLAPYKQFAGEVINQILFYYGDHVLHHRIISLDMNRSLIVVVFPFLWYGIRMLLKTEIGTLLKLIPFFIAVLFILLLLYLNNNPDFFPKVAILIVVFIISFQFLLFRLERQEFVTLLALSLFLNYFLTRADQWHYATMLPLIGLMIPWIQLIGNPKNNYFINSPRYLAIFLIFILCFPGSFSGRNSFIPNSNRILTGLKLLSSCSPLLVQGDSHYIMSGSLPIPWPESAIYPDIEEIKALRYVYKRTTPNDSVYIGLTDHSRTHKNHVRSYWLLDRKIGVRFPELNPGITTEPDVQKAMIRDLVNNNVRWIVLWRGNKGDVDFVRRNYVGAKDLDKYITSKFKRVRRFKRFLVYKRKE
jgi:hypothetical protein